MKDTGKLKKELKKSLPEKRYLHSLGVADTAAELAGRFGCDPDRAYLAGLLHDCAKGMSHEEMLSYASSRGYEPDEVTLGALQILHAPVSAMLAEEKYGVTDSGILDAIRYHTTGRAGMSTLEKIIFVADLTEPGRDFEGVGELRKASEEDLTKACLAAVDSSIMTVIKRGGLLHPAAVDAHNSLTAEVKRNEP